MATQITPKLWLGDINVAQDSQFLTSHDIKNVIDLGSMNNKFLRGICYWKFNIGDLPTAPIWVIFPLCNKIIDDGPCTLVHCSAGRSRSPTVVLSWLMHSGMTLRDALKFLCVLHPKTSPNIGFLKQLTDQSINAKTFENHIETP